MDELRDAVEEKHLKNGQQALDELRQIICQELTPRYPMELDGKPAVILVIGVNGVGKTTTIAKLAHLYKEKGKRCLLYTSIVGAKSAERPKYPAGVRGFPRRLRDGVPPRFCGSGTWR